MLKPIQFDASLCLRVSRFVESLFTSPENSIKLSILIRMLMRMPVELEVCFEVFGVKMRIINAGSSPIDRSTHFKLII